MHGFYRVLREFLNSSSRFYAIIEPKSLTIWCTKQ